MCEHQWKRVTESEFCFAAASADGKLCEHGNVGVLEIKCNK